MLVVLIALSVMCSVANAEQKYFACKDNTKPMNIDNGTYLFVCGEKYTIDTMNKVVWSDTESADVDMYSKTEANTQNQALIYCSNLTIGNLNNFRLPTVDELTSIKFQQECSAGGGDDCRIFKYSGTQQWSNQRDKIGSWWNGVMKIKSKDGTSGTRCISDNSLTYNNAMLQYNNALQQHKIEISRKEQQAKQQEISREIKITNFRKNLQEGDETSSGLVVQIKGNLVKIQTNDEQCSQRDYNGSCKNWINTPVEKWVKRSEVYPK